MSDFERQLNILGKNRTPFLFLTDFEMNKPLLIPLDDHFPDDVLFNINGFSNHTTEPSPSSILLKKQPISFDKYVSAFKVVQDEQCKGNSYLANLTFKTPISTECSLREIYFSAQARYKLLFKNQFVVFSPEGFVHINRGQIFTFPMKGTIDADIPDAKRIILEDEKELAEHFTIVDLLRNDLSIVAKNVQVKRFRYFDHIKTPSKNLLQVSSEISGELPENYCNEIGSIITKLLPAGSICGAPKKSTVEIIRKAEEDERGYYTGVAGYFDGENLTSFVMIRYIERNDQGLFYRSGGGITINSKQEVEYNELIDKIYVPTH